MVDIIIPAYNAHETLERTLNSILNQTMYSKIKIILVDDNSEKNYDDIINKFSGLLDIKYFKMDKNIGPGAARQFGVDNSNGSYIMFVDADDILTDALAIREMSNYMNQNHNCAVISAAFLEESEIGKMFMHNNEMVSLCAKLYRRSFLQKNDLVISSGYFYEDLEFNTKIRLSLKDKEYIQFMNDKIIYIWKFNKNSATRKNDFEFVYNQGLNESINAKIRAIDIPGANPYFVKNEIITTIFYCYNQYNLLLNDKPEKHEWIDKAFSTMLNFWEKRGKSIYEEISESEKNINFIRTKNRSNKHVIPKITFFEFVDVLNNAIIKK